MAFVPRWKWKSLSLMQRALLISLAVHVAVLTLRFASPQTWKRLTDDSPLEVTLVNVDTTSKPDKAQALAQVSLAGGGSVEKGLASAPVLAGDRAQTGDPEKRDAEEQKQALLAQQNLLVQRVKAQLLALSQDAQNEDRTLDEKIQAEQKRQALSNTLAKIEERIQAENARPRKAYVSPAVREVVYARYYDSMRRKIEMRGTSHFPERNGEKLYGALTMMVTVNFTGEVLDVEIVKGSGNPALDFHAQAVARSAGPFGAFTKEMRQTLDQLVVVARFSFARDETLQTQALGSP
jgi:protein TonB